MNTVELAHLPGPPAHVRSTSCENTAGFLSLYGRSRESHALLASFKRAAAGGTELVVMSGPAGIGKTTLVQPMRSVVTRQRGYYISGKFDQLQRDVPFSAIVTALHDLVLQLLTEPAAQLRVWRDAIQAAVGRNGRVITDVVPALERIVGPQPLLPAVEPTETQNRFNQVFQSFLQVFCRQNRPLVIFLDDLQWADAASLRLLTQLLAAQGTESMLVIAACRDNEVTATHPFMLATKELERRTVPVSFVKLGPLGWADIVQMIGDSLRVAPDSAAALAETIREKTGGNPFFVRQFLQKLEADGLLRYDPGSETHRFDLSAIRAAGITDNVAELVATKIARLEPEAQRVLSIAAAIGNRFDLGILASVAGCAQSRATELLAPALRDQLIAQTPGNGTDHEFKHDRIQQAAYALVPAANRPALNLAIGRVLLGSAGDDITAVLFEVVNHMNQGIALIDSRAERLRLAKLNLQAASRARNSTAYDLAVRASRGTIELLGWDAWTEHFAMALEAHMILAECLTLIADFEGAFRAIDAALPHVRSPADTGRLQAARTHTFLSMGDMTGAVACGRHAAQLFGLDLPEKPERVREQLQKEIAVILEWSAEHPIESLLDLPPMTDPNRVALMSLLMQCIPPAYQVNPELFALICSKMVTLSIEHGNCPMSAKGYGSFAVILSGIVGNLRDGDRFGKLGVDLCERLNDIAVRSACHFTWAAFASAWVRPIDESIAVFRDGVRWGLQSGDHAHVAYNAARGVTHMFFRGMPLGAAIVADDDARQLLKRTCDVTNVSLLSSRRRLAEWLRGEGVRHSLDAPGFDEAALLRALEGASASKSMLSHLQMIRLMHRYFAGELREAWRISQKSDELLMYSTGMLTIVEHVFFQSLVMTGLWTESSAQERAEFAARLHDNEKRLRTWAGSCPANFASLHRTLMGEMARIRGDASAAQECFEQAIADARESAFIHIEALASELAMKACKAEDPERAALMHTRAVAAYQAWGATRKALELRSLLPDEAPSAV